MSWSYRRRGFAVLFQTRHFVFDFAPEIAGDDVPLDKRIHGWCLQHLYPRPNLVIFLDAPEALLLRAAKGSRQSEELERRRQGFLQYRHADVGLRDRRRDAAAPSGLFRGGRSHHAAVRAIAACTSKVRGQAMSAHDLRVLTYHRVVDPADARDCDPALISATPGDFERQVQYLAAHYNVVSAGQVVDAEALGRAPARQTRVGDLRRRVPGLR